MPAKKKIDTKYIFVTGGVISGLGKGITAASLGLLLKSAGFAVNILKEQILIVRYDVPKTGGAVIPQKDY